MEDLPHEIALSWWRWNPIRTNHTVHFYNWFDYVRKG